MDAQLEILRGIVRGDKPATLENILKAFNRDLLIAEATSEQNRSVQATTSLLRAEQYHLEKAIFKRKKQLERLRAGSSVAPPREPETISNLQLVHDVVHQLSQTHLLKFGAGNSEEIFKILWGIIKVTARSEQLIVPSNAEIVRFLISEGLIRSEPAGENKLRIRIL